MEYSARVANSAAGHEVTVRTGTVTQSLVVPAKTEGPGSGVNGGEFLLLALATCYCNDLYREARRLGIKVDGVEVEAAAEFNGIGLAAEKVRYHAKITSPASAAEIARLLRETDAVAEIQNTVRAAIPVELVE